MSEAAAIRQRPSLPAVVALLEAAQLPCVDLSDAHLEHFFLAGASQNPSGTIGLELFGRDALLRSLVVAERARNAGLGEALVRHAEQYAEALGVERIYLLTTTAERFFTRLGYESVSRDRAPVAIKQTSEFSSLCPASSAFLCRRL